VLTLDEASIKLCFPVDPLQSHRVVIVGGGFAGLFATRALSKTPVEVTLVDRANYHLFQPLLYQVATGILSEGEIAPPLRGILRKQTNVRVVLAEVRSVDPDERTVAATAPNGEPVILRYDSLVVAAGARHSYFGHDEWETHAPGLKSLEDARRLRSRLLGAFELAELTEDPAERKARLTFVVVGAGPTGVEVSGQIAELARRTLRRDYRDIDPSAARIVLIDAAPAVLPAFAEKLRRRAARDLTRMGIELRLETTAERIDEAGIDLKGPRGEAERIEARTVIWAAGVSASPLGRLLAEAAGAEVDRAGRIRVLPDLTLPGHPEVFACGDLASLEGLPGVAQVAMQQGRYAARTIEARLAGRPPPGPFRYRDKGTMATIGRLKAVAEIRGLKLGGFPAAAVWAFVHLAFLIGFANRLVTMTRWTFSVFAGHRSQRLLSMEERD
jgi:NADH dehydrogenase